MINDFLHQQLRNAKDLLVPNTYVFSDENSRCLREKSCRIRSYWLHSTIIVNDRPDERKEPIQIVAESYNYYGDYFKELELPRKHSAQHLTLILVPKLLTDMDRKPPFLTGKLAQISICLSSSWRQTDTPLSCLESRKNHSECQSRYRHLRRMCTREYRPAGTHRCAWVATERAGKTPGATCSLRRERL
jgi:hypothetical protein